MQAIERAGLMEQVARRIEAETGLRFSAARRRDLGNGLRRIAEARAAGAGAGEAWDAARWLLDGPWDEDRTALCARYLTVGETYFFREPRAFELLCDYARERLAADPGARLRLWSAGCCTGEEPYSMAMALRQGLPGLSPEQVSILGTDLNPASLVHARAGLYREWSFRCTEPGLRARYFTPAGAGQFALAPAIRDQVRFAQLNLALPMYPSAADGTVGIDIIFCRNVLMYFSRPLMAQVIARLRACLVEGGWLVVNPSEACAELFAGFSPTYHPDAVFYRKSDAPPARAPEPARSPARAQAPAAAGAAPAAPAPAPGPDVALAQAEALARAGEHGAALNCLARAASQWPLAAPLYLAAAQLALEQGDAGSARRHLQRLLYLEPGAVLAHYLDGIALAALARHPDARRAFSQAAALLDGLPDEAPVVGAGEWQAGTLRRALARWMERSA